MFYTLGIILCSLSILAYWAGYNKRSSPTTEEIALWVVLSLIWPLTVLYTCVSLLFDFIEFLKIQRYK
jgi:hypothetical protein